MERMWMLSLFGLALSCGDIAKQSPTELSTPWAVDEPTAATAKLVPIALPTTDDCVEPSIIGAANLENTRRTNPVVTETFGADGCLDERWIHEWDGERMTLETYDFFDPDLALYVYVAPIAYTHVWEHDAEGRVVYQHKTQAGSQTPFYVESKSFDDRGRLVGRTWRNSPFDAFSLDVTYTELWTFDGANTEFTTFTTLEDDLAVAHVRREFAYGQIAREFEAQGTADEQLSLSRRFDTAGGIIEEEIWQRGVPVIHAWIDRRADGTMLRRTQKNLQLGWLDVWQYDGAERITEYTQDETEDGRVDYRAVNRYDAAGNPTFESTEYGFDDPTTRYAQIVRTFDGQNRLIESVDTRTWLRGESQRVRVAYDVSGSGALTTVERLSPQGAVVATTSVTRTLAPDQVEWQRTDTDRDGQPDALETRLWDGDKPLERLFDLDADGVVDSTMQWRYDAAGQLVEAVTDSDADGVADARTLYQR